METQRELWHRLENESERAYRAFENFLSLPSGERTLLGAYRRHVGNPDAAKPSDTWSGWSNAFAWRERAAAYDDHLASLRREAYERGVEEEATRQAREVEKARGRYNELMTLSYVRATEWLEDAQRSDLRAQDVIQIIRLYMDAEKAFGAKEPKVEEGWTEEDETQMADLVEEIDALAENDEFGDGEDDSRKGEGEHS
jgi:hypothetical protein